MICNFFKYDDFRVLEIYSISSYNMVAILLSTPLQPQPNTKNITDEKATLMTGFILLADSMLEVNHEWEIFISRNKEALALFIYKPAYWNLLHLLCVYWIRGG